MTQQEKQSKEPGWFDGYSEQFKNLYGVDPRVGVQPNSFTRAAERTVANPVDTAGQVRRYVTNAATNANEAQKAFRSGVNDIGTNLGENAHNLYQKATPANAGHLAHRGFQGLGDFTLAAAGLDPVKGREDLAKSGPVKAVASGLDWLSGPATPKPGVAPSGVGPLAGAGDGSGGGAPSGATGGSGLADAGKTFGRGLMLTGGLGLGAVGTYYLLNKLMQGRRQKQRANKFQSMYGLPKFASAADVLQTIQDSAGKVKDYALNTLNSGADKLQKNIEGGVQQWLEPSPDGFVPGVLNKAMGVGGVAAGIGGTGLLMHYLNKHQKRQAEKHNIEDARNEYLAALTGEKSAALDAAYEKYATLADVVNDISAGVKNFGRGAATAAEDYTAAQLLAAGAGVGIGGTYMYNKTRNNSRSANALKAQALKARMRSLPGTWIDPEELVKVKQMAMANNAAAT